MTAYPAVMAVCTICGATNPEGSRFCNACGARLAAAAETVPERSGERRVVTMLFCDVRGSTAMAETLDAEAWTDVMNSAYELLIEPVVRHEGTVARLMGDAILAFFGAPTAHEDDPQRAVMAGLEIVSAIAPFKRAAARASGARSRRPRRDQHRSGRRRRRSARTCGTSTRRWATP